MTDPQFSPQSSDEPALDLTVREAVALFADPHDMDRAARELLTSGFAQHDVSVLATEAVVRARFGDRFQDTHAAADDPAAPRSALAAPEDRRQGRGALASVLGYVGAIAVGGILVATGGTTAAVVTAALLAGGAGAGLGAALGKIFDDHRADGFAEQIRHGGLLLWVRVCDPLQETCAIDILRRNNGGDVHVHTLELN